MTALAPPPPYPFYQDSKQTIFSDILLLIIAWFTLIHCSIIMTKILPRTFGFPVH